MDAVSPPAVPAVVPLKALRHAKGRLEEHLDAGDRRALTAWMLERVLQACAAARSVAGVLVVAGDAEAAALAHELGAETMLVAEPGLAAALGAADRALAGAPASLVVTADLPLATGAALDEVGTAGASVVVAESLDGGTSALLRRPHAVVATAFGHGSARAHLALAAGAGVAGTLLRVPALALDVDDARSLRAASARLPALAAWLAARGLGQYAAAS